MGLLKNLFSLLTSSGEDAVSAPSNNTTNKVETNPQAVEKTECTLGNNSDGLISKYVFRGEIKSGTPIMVSSDEMVVVIKDGIIVDLLPTGVYAINDSNVSNFVDGSAYTISLKESDKIRWGTTKPIIFKDSKYGMLSLRVCGNYSYAVCDVAKFVNDYMNAGSGFSLNDYTRTLVINAVEKAIHSYNGSSYMQLPAKDICKAVKDELNDTGFNFTVQIEMINLTKESEAVINQAMQNEILNNQ